MFPRENTWPHSFRYVLTDEQLDFRECHLPSMLDLVPFWGCYSVRSTGAASWLLVLECHTLAPGGPALTATAGRGTRNLIPSFWSTKCSRPRPELFPKASSSAEQTHPESQPRAPSSCFSRLPWNDYT